MSLVHYRHARAYERADPALLERQTGALDQAAPLVGWRLPEEFATLRRLLEARMSSSASVSSSKSCVCWRGLVWQMSRTFKDVRLIEVIRLEADRLALSP